MLKKHGSLNCSFCDKPQTEVKKLIAGGVQKTAIYICDECISVCVAIIEDDKGFATNEQGGNDFSIRETYRGKMMSEKHDSAELILKLYELRRESVMREARNWFSTFNPESAQDIVQTLMGEHSAHYRMVTSYWEMAASLVNHGAIDAEMFSDATGEQLLVFTKIEPYLNELRQMFKVPHAMKHLEQLVMNMPDAKERIETMRERFKMMAQMRAEAEARESKQEAANA